MAGDSVPIYRVTFEDTFVVSQELEQEYQCAITWRHSARERQQKWSFSVALTAWEVLPDGCLRPLCTSYTYYPSGQHGSMAGAVLDALYDLGSRLQAQRVLRQLPLDLGA